MSVIKKRYHDAYSLSRATNSTGQLIKLLGAVIAGVGCVAAAIAGSKLGGGVGVAVLLLALGVASQIYALGVVIAAQGQLLMASLDTAVNTSPLLTHEEVRDILTGADALASGAGGVSEGATSAESWRCSCGHLNPPALGRCSGCRAWRSATRST